MKDKEKIRAYDEALERAKKVNKCKADDREPGTSICEYIFPELKESEDERIRNLIINHLTQERGSLSNDEAAEAIAWLEQQYQKETICNKEDEEIKKDIATFIFNYRGYIKDRVKWINYLGFNVSFVEEQSEQKTVDKIEPKFKVGYWITNGDYTWKIIDVKSLDYTLQSQDGNIVDDNISYVDEHFNLWSINNIKDGDIVVEDKIKEFPSPFIAIFKRRNDDDFESYCFIGFNGKFYTGEAGHDLQHLHPATKEQYDLLFTEMKEAGYKWDIENKELKKIEDDSEDCKQQIMSEITDFIKDYIEQKSVWWSEEDEKILKDILIDVKFEGYNNDMLANSYKKINWLKSLKERCTWKPSIAQLNALSIVSKGNAPDDIEAIVSLYNDLKKLM